MMIMEITKEKEVATTQQPTRTTNPTRLIARLQAILDGGPLGTGD